MDYRSILHRIKIEKVLIILLCFSKLNFNFRRAKVFKGVKMTEREERMPIMSEEKDDYQYQYEYSVQKILTSFFRLFTKYCKTQNF